MNNNGLIYLLDFLNESDEINVVALDGYVASLSNGQEYIICNSSERYELAEIYVEGTLNSFEPIYLSEATGLPIEVFEIEYSLTDMLQIFVATNTEIGTITKIILQEIGYGILANTDLKEISLSDDLYAYRIT